MPISRVISSYRLWIIVSTILLLVCVGWAGFYISLWNESPNGSTKPADDPNFSEQPSTLKQATTFHEVAASSMPTIDPETWKRASSGILLQTWRKLVASTNLTDLKHKRLAPGDIEIRIWSLPGFAITKDKCWVFALKDGRWEAYVVVDRNLDRTITKEKLSPPSDDWDKWNSYVINTITPSKIREMPIAKVSTNDGPTIGVEVEYGSDYEMAFIANDDFENDLFKVLKSEFLNNDQPATFGLAPWVLSRNVTQLFNSQKQFNQDRRQAAREISDGPQEHEICHDGQLSHDQVVAAARDVKSRPRRHIRTLFIALAQLAIKAKS